MMTGLTGTAVAMVFVKIFPYMVAAKVFSVVKDKIGKGR